jgi:hypothetical protein
MAQLVKYRTINGTAPRIPIQDVVLNMSRVISVSTESKTGRGVMVYENDQGPVTIYTSEVASYTKSKMTGYVNAIMLKYNVYKGERDQYFVVDNIVYAIKTPSDPTNLTDIYILDDTSQLVNKITIEAPIQVLIADANQVSFNGATWGGIDGNIADQLDLQAEFDTKVDKITTITINAVTYDLSANRSWTVPNTGVWGSITGTLSAQTDLQAELDAKVPTARTLTINAVTYDLSANRSWTVSSGIAIGDTITGGTAGRVLFVDVDGKLGQDSGLFWHADTKRLIITNGVGTTQLGAGSSGADIILSTGGTVYTSAIWSSIFGPRGSGEAFSWSDWDGNPLMTLITATGATKGNVGIGTSSPTSFADIAASTATRASLRLRSGTLPTVPNAGDISYDGAFKGWNGSTWTTFGGGLINFTESYSSSVGHSSKFAAIGVGTNINVVLNPKGTGGFIAQTPDSTATGGNARGSRIVDWQTSRGSADQVASGDSSVISGGSFNTASAINTVVSGGNRNIASGIASVVVGGINGRAYLYGQQAKASGSFTGITSDIGIAQASEVIVRRLTSAVNSGDNSQLYADAAQSELLIPFGSNRSWNVIVETVAVCTIVGSGSGTVGDTYTSVYQLGFKRVGGTSTIVGTATLISSNSGAGMAGALMVFSVGASNDLKIEFQAPSTATATTFRIVSNVRLVEIDFN